jgi:hypothetical protein
MRDEFCHHIKESGGIERYSINKIRFSLTLLAVFRHRKFEKENARFSIKKFARWDFEIMVARMMINHFVKWQPFIFSLIKDNSMTFWTHSK